MPALILGSELIGQGAARLDEYSHPSPDLHEVGDVRSNTVTVGRIAAVSLPGVNVLSVRIVTVRAKVPLWISDLRKAVLAQDIRMQVADFRAFSPAPRDKAHGRDDHPLKATTRRQAKSAGRHTEASPRRCPRGASVHPWRHSGLPHSATNSALACSSHTERPSRLRPVNSRAANLQDLTSCFHVYLRGNVGCQLRTRDSRTQFVDSNSRSRMTYWGWNVQKYLYST